jgi:hypothetical protein
MERQENKKRRRKAFKQSSRHRIEKVSNVKPYPIPDLEGQLAQDFERKIREPPTNVRKKMMCEATVVFNQTKIRE